MNGKLSEDGSSFVRFGLENKAVNVKVDVNADNITVIRDEHVTIYDWMAAIEILGSGIHVFFKLYKSSI